MDNKQLKLLLENYSRRLNDIIERIESENTELQEECKHLMGSYLMYSSRRIKAIDPLRDFLSDLNEDIDSLNER